MLITKGQLNFAGCFSIMHAIVTFVFFIIIMKVVTVTETVETLLALISLGLFIYVFSSLRKLLNLRFKFRDVDTYISVLIWGNVVLFIFSTLFLGSYEQKIALSYLSVAAFVFLEILYVVFAIKILRLPDNLFGLLKPFSYTSIAGGLCLASIILIPFGLIATTAADIILGKIFFRTAEQSS